MILPAGRPPEISAGAPAKPLPPDEFPVLAWGISVAALTMAKAPTTDAIAAELTVPERVLPFLPLDPGKTEDRRLDQAALLMGYGDLDGSVPLFLIALFAVFDARKAISHGPRKGLWVTRPGPRRPSSAQHTPKNATVRNETRLILIFDRQVGHCKPDASGGA